MSPTSAPDGSARPSAATLNARIRAFTRGRLYWPREALAELGRLQAAYLAAEQAEDRPGRRDVAGVA